MTYRIPSSSPPGMATALNAIRNASRVGATAVDVANMLATGCGPPAYLRALFGDVSDITLMRLAVALDIETEALLASYVRAKAVGAANPALDALLV